ncbi:hypothetical protein F4604DRAFT_1915744 [Suillus subluteus]|nr:hypothetical protein F4604DRAFT_1915744 [Suillus subluteus]
MSAQPPPSTIFSKSQKSVSSAATSLNSYLNPPSTKVSALVGAFGDEDLDDSLEHDVALTIKGKVPMKSVVALAEETNPDLVPLPLAQRQNRSVSGKKRKMLHDPITDLSESSDLISDEDSSTMELDGFEEIVVKQSVKAEVKVEKAPCTTSSTSVATTSSKAPPSKKVKTAKELSPSMVVKQDGSWAESVLKACSTYLNTDLPPGCHEDSKWARVFLPTVFLWLGAQEDIWAISDANLLRACHEIFKVVYPDIKYQVATSGSVFGIVTQCVSEWCSNFGSTALAIVINFCISNKDTSAKELAALFLHHYAFLYPNPDEIDKKETFRSTFSGIAGALGLCAVLLERAFDLIKDSIISIDHLEDTDVPATSRKTCFKTPKTLNKVTGKETSTEHTFSVVKWGSKTTAFICTAQKKGLEAIQLTVSMAYKHLKKPGAEKHASIDSDDEMDDREDVW